MRRARLHSLVDWFWNILPKTIQQEAEEPGHCGRERSSTRKGLGARQREDRHTTRPRHPSWPAQTWRYCIPRAGERQRSPPPALVPSRCCTCNFRRLLSVACELLVTQRTPYLVVERVPAEKVRPRNQGKQYRRRNGCSSNALTVWLDLCFSFLSRSIPSRSAYLLYKLFSA